jgi:hypothetical protein
MQNKIAHLTLIQGVINRIAGNSALLKGWTVTLVAATFALSAKDADTRFILIAYVPTVMFWILDSYYLQQERLLRDLHNKVRQKQESEIDFAMDTSEFSRSLIAAFFAPVNFAFYGFLIGIILVVMFVFQNLHVN